MNLGAASFACYSDNGYGGDITSHIFIRYSYAVNRHVLLRKVGHAFDLKHSFEGNTYRVSDIDNLLQHRDALYGRRLRRRRTGAATF